MQKKKKKKQLSNESPVFCCNRNNFSGYFCTAVKQCHYQLILARSERELHLYMKLTITGCIEFFPFFILEDTSLWWPLWYTLVFSNLVHCIVYFSILTPCTSEKILSAILLHILKPTNEGSWAPQKFFFLNFNKFDI